MIKLNDLGVGLDQLKSLLENMNIRDAGQTTLHPRVDDLFDFFLSNALLMLESFPTMKFNKGSATNRLQNNVREKNPRAPLESVPSTI